MSVPILMKSIKKCDRESARIRRTDTQTDRQTQTDFIICPMLYVIAMGQITRNTFCGTCMVYIYINGTVVSAPSTCNERTVPI